MHGYGLNEDKKARGGARSELQMKNSTVETARAEFPRKVELLKSRQDFTKGSESILSQECLLNKIL